MTRNLPYSAVALRRNKRHIIIHAEDRLRAVGYAPYYDYAYLNGVALFVVYFLFIVIESHSFEAELFTQHSLAENGNVLYGFFRRTEGVDEPESVLFERAVIFTEQSQNDSFIGCKHLETCKTYGRYENYDEPCACECEKRGGFGRFVASYENKSRNCHCKPCKYRADNYKKHQPAVFTL